MKKILQLTKQTLILAILILVAKDAEACSGAKIKIDTSLCTSMGLAKMKLTSYTPSAGITYNWQMSNDGGLSFNTLISNSGADTQNINPGLAGRMYRCIITCTAGTFLSDTLSIFYSMRNITVDRVLCSSTAGGNDSLVLRASALTTATDTAFAKNFKWQFSTTGGLLWNTLPSIRDTVKVKFTSNIIQYRAFVSFCPLSNVQSTLPNSPPQLINKIDIGLDNIGLAITDRDCTNDTARLSLTNVSLTLQNVFKYRWYDSTTASGAFNYMGLSDSFIRVKVNNVNRFYKASVKLCTTPYPSVDSLYTNTYAMWVKLGNFTSALDCQTEKVTLDYTNRNIARNSVYLYWTKSINDSTSHTAFSVPVDSVAYAFSLMNYTKEYYKVYSKFCPNSASILDSSYNLKVMLKIDTGQLKANILACNNDSVYMKLLNYNDSSSFPLYKQWMIKRNGSAEFETYTKTPMTDTTIAFRMSNGWNTYRKSVTFCTDKYARKFSSTEASTFLPYQLVDTIACTGNMTVRVADDTVRVKDYTGTTIRGNGSFGYQWMKSTNNKLTSSIIAGANGAFLTITQADKRSFFRRITRICSSNTTQDTTNWSNLVFGNPNALNGRAEVFDEVCLNDSVRICVSNNTYLATDTPTYIWQVSNDDINWTNILSYNSNDSCLKVLVEPVYRYYRRLTYWCPSGTKDSTVSTPLIYVQNLPWCESFTNQLLFGKDVYYNCWRGSSPVCSSYSPTYAGSQIWSQSSGGKTSMMMSNWGPAAIDQKNPPGRKADGKLITPAFHLKRGKIYRFSFWHKESLGNLCWDSVYVTWGTKPSSCDINNKFGKTLTKFSFDQYNKYWADFLPPDDGIYYFGINFREQDATIGEIDIDDVCLKEIESCEGKTPAKGATFAPSKLIDRVEEPSIATNYQKTNVQHQYCIHDTIMLTYQENNYNSNFDYYGMTYQFWKKRQDADWKIEDTFFRPMIADTLCHISNNTAYHVLNVLVTDTNTWYKIVATCQFDGKTYHADSLLVNGTHSVPYCEDWQGVANGNINNPNSAMPQKNSQEIVGKVPGFAACPTCWAAFPQNSKTNPTPANMSLYSVTLPFRNTPTTNPPQLEPDQGWVGNNVVINSDITVPILTRKVLVMPAVRLYKGRGYRVSFRWTDNRRTQQSPYGNANQDLDSLYLIVSKGNQSGKVVDSFPRTKMVPGSLRKDLQSNILETGSFKYRTYWVDYTPSDTGTYYFGIAVVAGSANGNAYRFQMDYFCIDTLTFDTSCNSQPLFVDPLRIRISPDGKMWNPGDTTVSQGQQWCVGNRVNLEIDFGMGEPNNWNYGWKYYWQKNVINPSSGNPPVWTTIDSTNAISYVLTYKYQDYRLILLNACGTKGDTIGPFKVAPPGGDLPWIEGFDSTVGIPPCWEVYPPCRDLVTDIQNQYHQSARSPNNYMYHDYYSPASPNCPTATSQTSVPPGFGLAGGVTHRFSFWYRDNGISMPIDSIRAAWSYVRPTAAATNRMLNLVNSPADIVKNTRSGKWRYYTSEITPAVDTTIHVKVTSFNLANKFIYTVMFDDFMMKVKQNTDALVIAVDSPDYQCDLQANTNLKITVMNIGYNTLANIPVKVSVDNGTPVSYVVPGPVASNQTKTAYVPGIDLSGLNNHTVRVWTDVAGEQHSFDDTFTTQIIHNELYPKPTDTVDSVCICSNLRYNENSPNGQTRWYKSMTDATPFQIGDVLAIDSLCKDTCFVRSTWNGGVCNTTPNNFSYGAPTYSTAAGGLTFDNISKDTILIDSVMVYANTISATPFNITISQFAVANVIASTPPLVISKLGRQWLPIKIKIPPGTDYKIRYPGGASLAQLPNFIYIGSGCPSFEFNINGDINYPAAPTAYSYFFNMRLIKLGCESERVPICFRTVATPTFKIKDTNRVCSQPIYNVCGPVAPTGSTYTYLWHNAETTMCTGALQTGWYKLSVTNQFGCTEKDSLNLTVDPSPQFNLGPDTSFCRYSPHTIKTNLDSSSNVVTWSDNQSGVSIKVWNPGTYIATAYNTANFCTGKDTIVLNRRELPVFSLGNDRVFCGSSADISTTLPTTGLTYQWSPGAPNITVDGKYWVTGTDVYGCKNSDTILADLVAYPVVNLGNDTAVCGPTHTIKGPVGSYHYTWSTTATTRNITISTPGTYYLTVTDSAFGCQSVDSIKITFKTIPVFSLGPDVVKCAVTHVITGPAGMSTYKWKKPGGVFTVGSATYVADTSGDYELEVSNGCFSYTDKVNLKLKYPADTAINLLKDTFGCREVAISATTRNDYSRLNWGYPILDTANIVLVKKTGTYSVSLTNECGTATKFAYIRIDSTPVANFSIDYPNCMSVALTNLSRNGVSYYWQFGDAGSSTDENPVHNYTAEGDYLVTLKASNSCGFSSKTLPISKRIVNCGSSSGIVATTLEASQMYIFPNPTKDATQLIGVGLPNGNYTVNIKNLLGQTVYLDEIKITNNQIDLKLDVSKFANGEYLVNIANDSETIVRKLQVIK